METKETLFNIEKVLTNGEWIDGTYKISGPISWKWVYYKESVAQELADGLNAAYNLGLEDASRRTN